MKLPDDWRPKVGAMMVMLGLSWIHPGLALAVIGAVLIAIDCIREHQKLGEGSKP